MRTIVLLTVMMLFATISTARAAEPKYSDITFTVQNDGVVTIAAKTTLPEGTAVSIWLRQLQPKPKALCAAVPPNYPDAMDPAVKDGMLQGTMPSATEKGIPAGNYELVFTTPPSGANAQSYHHPLTIKKALQAQPKEWKEPASWK